MDNILIYVSSFLGELLSKDIDCNLNCDIENLGLTEYTLLIALFITTFLVA